MKGLRLLFAVCLAPLAFGLAWADDATDTVRAAVRRGTPTAPQTTQSTTQRTRNSERATTGDAQNTTHTTGTISRTQNAIERTQHNATQSNSQRTGNSAVVSRDQRTKANTTTRTTGTTARTTTQRVTTPATSAPRVGTRSPTQTRTSTTRTATTPATTQKTTTRAARDTTATPGTVLSNNYQKCRQVYYSCMDEFCANKDSNLGRCACSNRTNEFKKIKKNLAAIEDKMLTFNQRLLTVNMDKEDAAALYQATEGEIAYNQPDKTASKKMLDEIAKKLNTSFNDSNFDRSMTAISLSLNMDAAFDSVDSLQGAATTAKSGQALYSAALPVCREMAQEVCSSDELDIAESGYQMTIEQDCNTVLKSYQAQTDQARDTVREGSALLDMSRLNAHQTRNSDDLLTCKKKMLDMLTDSSVCGSDMGKCLDVTGQYIDPTTGAAFLTVNLVNLNTLITRPTGTEKWTTAPGNLVFVSFLNNKRKYLEPAMENCQAIADTVWNEFIEDALAQIKLAQDGKLETMRQSCTTLTTQCMTDAAKSLSDFDARALSTFGVTADKTVTAMCAEVKTACTALMNANVDPGSGGGTSSSTNTWSTGMTDIANRETYETILNTCREVGRACIIQACTSISGNFGLCENIQTSINRKSIINRTACWDEVVKCVANAGTDKIDAIIAQLTAEGVYKQDNTRIEDPLINQPNFYSATYDVDKLKLYAQDPNNGSYIRPIDSECTDPNNEQYCVYDICADKNSPCQTDPSGSKCHICRIAEQIWGNCEVAPTTTLSDASSHNRILTNTKSNVSTLLSWFAQNTGTADSTDSCRDTSCPAGQKYAYIQDGDTQRWFCAASTTAMDACNKICEKTTFEIMPGINNCCPTTALDFHGNCSTHSISSATLLTPMNIKISTIKDAKTTQNSLPTYSDNKFSTPTEETAIVFTNSTNKNHVIAKWNLEHNDGIYKAGNYVLICSNTNDIRGEDTTDANYPSGKIIHCKDGLFILVNLSTGEYFTPGKGDTQISPMSVNPASGGTNCTSQHPDCFYYVNPTNSGWKKENCDENLCYGFTNCDTTPLHWTVSF